MAGFTPEVQQQVLDYVFPVTGATDHVAYSTDGTTEFAGLARTSVTADGWAPATADTPSVKSNDVELISAEATAAGTITHQAIFSAATAGSQKTDWEPLTETKPVGIGDQVRWVVGAIQVKLD